MTAHDKNAGQSEPDKEINLSARRLKATFASTKAMLSRSRALIRLITYRNVSKASRGMHTHFTHKRRITQITHVHVTACINLLHTHVYMHVA